MKEILFLEPVFKEMIWGGNKLATNFGYDIPSDKTGECWAIAAHKNGDSKIIGSEYDGKTLSTLWMENRELFGSLEGDVFPLLVKILDAKDDLSIQVHPDDDYAMKNENGSLGKTECWYVLDCEENTTIIIGHNAKDSDDLRSMIEKGEWKKLLREVPIKKGDFFQIDPGCVHAIKGGTVIFETQQNSDITYRVYDYGRLSDGKPRELHTQKALDVIKTPFDENDTERKIIQKDGCSYEQLVKNSFYTVEKIDICSKTVFERDAHFVNVSVVEGEGTVDGTAVFKGSHFIIPYGYGAAMFDGNMELIVSYV